MTQKYPDGEVVYAPGTVIISAVGEVHDITKTVSPVIQPLEGSKLIYIDFSGDSIKTWRKQLRSDAKSAGQRGSYNKR